MIYINKFVLVWRSSDRLDPAHTLLSSRASCNQYTWFVCMYHILNLSKQIIWPNRNSQICVYLSLLQLGTSLAGAMVQQHSMQSRQPQLQTVGYNGSDGIVFFSWTHNAWMACEYMIIFHFFREGLPMLPRPLRLLRALSLQWYFLTQTFTTTTPIHQRTRVAADPERGSRPPGHDVGRKRVSMSRGRWHRGRILRHDRTSQARPGRHRPLVV